MPVLITEKEYENNVKLFSTLYDEAHPEYTDHLLPLQRAYERQQEDQGLPLLPSMVEREQKAFKENVAKFDTYFAPGGLDVAEEDFTFDPLMGDEGKKNDVVLRYIDAFSKTKDRDLFIAEELGLKLGEANIDQVFEATRAQFGKIKRQETIGEEVFQSAIEMAIQGKSPTEISKTIDDTLEAEMVPYDSAGDEGPVQRFAYLKNEAMNVATKVNSVIASDKQMLDSMVDTVELQMDGVSDADSDELIKTTLEKLKGYPTWKRNIAFNYMITEAKNRGSENAEGKPFPQVFGEAVGRMFSDMFLDKTPENMIDLSMIFNQIKKDKDFFTTVDRIETPEQAKQFIFEQKELNDAMSRRDVGTGAAIGGGMIAQIQEKGKRVLTSEEKSLIFEAVVDEVNTLETYTSLKEIERGVDSWKEFNFKDLSTYPSTMAKTLGQSAVIMGALGLTRGLALPTVMQGYANLNFQNYIDKGATPDQAYRAAGIAGIIEGGLDMLQLKFLTRLTPLTRLLKGGSVAKFGAARFAQRFGSTLVGELGIEVVQEATPMTVAATFEFLDESFPQIEWTKEMKDVIAMIPEIGVGMIPMALFGAGIAQTSDIKNAKALFGNADALRALGYQEKDVVAIIDTNEQQGEEAAGELIREAWNRRDTELIKEVATKLQTEETKVRQVMQLARDSGIVPTFRKVGDKYVVEKPDGTYEQVSTADELYVKIQEGVVKGLNERLNAVNVEDKVRGNVETLNKAQKSIATQQEKVQKDIKTLESNDVAAIKKVLALLPQYRGNVVTTEEAEDDLNVDNVQIKWGELGTEHTGLTFEQAIETLTKDKSGIATDVLTHPAVGNISLVWGVKGQVKARSMGLAKVLGWHSDFDLNNIKAILEDPETKITENSKLRAIFRGPKGNVIIKKKLDGKKINWVTSAYATDAEFKTELTDEQVMAVAREQALPLLRNNLNRLNQQAATTLRKLADTVAVRLNAANAAPQTYGAVTNLLKVYGQALGLSPTQVEDIENSVFGANDVTNLKDKPASTYTMDVADVAAQRFNTTTERIISDLQKLANNEALENDLGDEYAYFITSLKSKNDFAKYYNAERRTAATFTSEVTDQTSYERVRAAIRSELGLEDQPDIQRAAIAAPTPLMRTPINSSEGLTWNVVDPNKSTRLDSRQKAMLLSLKKDRTFVKYGLTPVLAIPNVKNAQNDPQGIGKANGEWLNALKELYGVNIVFFDTLEGLYSGTAGFYHKESNTIYVSIRQPNSTPYAWVVGHEFGHFLQKTLPDVYEQLRDTVLEQVSEQDFITYIENLAPVYFQSYNVDQTVFVDELKKLVAANIDWTDIQDQMEKLGYHGGDVQALIDAITAEFTNDYLGREMLEGKLMPMLAKKKPNLFSKIANAFQKLLNYLTSRLASIEPTRDVHKLLSGDLDQMRRRVSNILISAAQITNEAGYKRLWTSFWGRQYSAFAVDQGKVYTKTKTQEWRDFVNARKIGKGKNFEVLRDASGKAIGIKPGAPKATIKYQDPKLDILTVLVSFNSPKSVVLNGKEVVVTYEKSERLERGGWQNYVSDLVLTIPAELENTITVQTDVETFEVDLNDPNMTDDIRQKIVAFLGLNEKQMAEVRQKILSTMSDEAKAQLEQDNIGSINRMEIVDDAMSANPAVDITEEQRQRFIESIYEGHVPVANEADALRRAILFAPAAVELPILNNSTPLYASDLYIIRQLIKGDAAALASKPLLDIAAANNLPPADVLALFKQTYDAKIKGYSQAVVDFISKITDDQMSVALQMRRELIDDYNEDIARNTGAPGTKAGPQHVYQDPAGNWHVEPMPDLLMYIPDFTNLPQVNSIEYVRLVKEMFGINVILFSSTSMGDQSYGGSYTSKIDTIFLNPFTETPSLFIFGHEFTHAIQLNAPQLYNNIRQIVMSGTSSTDKTMFYSTLHDQYFATSQELNDIAIGAPNVRQAAINAIKARRSKYLKANDQQRQTDPDFKITVTGNVTLMESVEGEFVAELVGRMFIDQTFLNLIKKPGNVKTQRAFLIAVMASINAQSQKIQNYMQNLLVGGVPQKAAVEAIYRNLKLPLQQMQAIVANEITNFNKLKPTLPISQTDAASLSILKSVVNVNVPKVSAGKLISTINRLKNIASMQSPTLSDLAFVDAVDNTTSDITKPIDVVQLQARALGAAAVYSNVVRQNLIVDIEMLLNAMKGMPQNEISRYLALAADPNSNTKLNDLYNKVYPRSGIPGPTYTKDLLKYGAFKLLANFRNKSIEELQSISVQLGQLLSTIQLGNPFIESIIRDTQTALQAIATDVVAQDLTAKNLQTEKLKAGALTHYTDTITTFRSLLQKIFPAGEQMGRALIEPIQNIIDEIDQGFLNVNDAVYDAEQDLFNAIDDAYGIDSLKTEAGLLVDIPLTPLTASRRASIGRRKALYDFVDNTDASNKTNITITIDGKKRKLSQSFAAYVLNIADQNIPAYNSQLIEKGFTPAVVNELRIKIDPKTEQMRRALRERVQAEYAKMSQVFSEVFGFAPAKPGPMFYPVIAKSRDVTLQDKFEVTYSSGKMRSGFETIEDFTNIELDLDVNNQSVHLISVFYSHMYESAYQRNMFKPITKIKGIVTDKKVKEAIELAYGTNTYELLIANILAFENNGLRSSAMSQQIAQGVRRAMTSVSRAAMGFKISTFFVNFMSGLNTFMDSSLPILDIARGYFAAMGGIVTGRYKKTLNNRLMQSRLIQGSNTLVQLSQTTDFADKPTWLKDVARASLQPMSKADAYAGTIAAMAAYTAHYNVAMRRLKKLGFVGAQLKKLAEEEAEMGMVRTVTKTAQPTIVAGKSLWELESNPWMKMTLMFMSETRKTLGLEIAEIKGAVRKAQKGEILGAGADVARSLFVYHMLLGSLTFALRGIVQDLMNPEDEDDEIWNPAVLAMYMTLGPLSGFPMLGSMADSTVRSMINALIDFTDADVDKLRVFGSGSSAITSTLEAPKDIMGDIMNLPDSETPNQDLTEAIRKGSAGLSTLFNLIGWRGTGEVLSGVSTLANIAEQGAKISAAQEQ